MYVYSKKMKKKEYDDLLDQRKNEKAIFERKQILVLQDEEIHRLKDEHFTLLKQIQTTENHFVKVNKLYNDRTSKLRDSIQSYSAKRVTLRIKLYKSHTEQISKMRAEHQANLQKLQTEYAQKMKEAKQNPIKLNSDGRQTSVEVISTSIDRIHTLTERVMQEKATANNEIIEKRLNEYKSMIESYRQREIDLRQQIDAARKDLTDSRERNKIRLKEATELAHKNSLRNEKTAAKTDDIMLMQRANNVSKLNEIRVNEIESLEALKESINAVKKKIFEYKTKITDCNVQEIQESKKAQESVDQLVLQLDKLNNNEIAAHMMRYNEREKEEKSKSHKFKKLLDSLEKERNLLISENSRLRSEIRRIDFMLYGRNGIHQIQKVNNKIPYVPVALH